MDRAGPQPQGAGREQPVFAQRWFRAQVSGADEMSGRGCVHTAGSLRLGQLRQLVRQGGIRACGRGHPVRQRSRTGREPRSRLCAGRPAGPGSDRHRWRPAPADAETGPGGHRPSWFSASNRAATASSSASAGTATSASDTASASEQVRPARRPPRPGPVSLGRTPPGGPPATSPATGERAAARSAAASTAGSSSSIRQRVYSGFPPVWRHSRRAAGPDRVPAAKARGQLGYLRRPQTGQPHAPSPVINQPPPPVVNLRWPLRPGRHHRQDMLLAQPAQGEPQSLRGGMVDPVEILHHQHHRPPRR